VTPRQRVLNAICRRGRGEFPIQLDVTDRALQQLGARWGFEQSPASRFTVLHNHLVFAKPDSLQIGDEEGAGNSHTDAWNVKWATDQEGVWVQDHPVALWEDLRSYRAPDVCSRIGWESVAEAVRRYSGEFCVVGYQNALLFERAWSLRGFERLLFDMADDLAGVEAFLDVITDAQIRVAQRFVTFGIDVARTGDDWGGQHGMLFAPGLWRRLIKPRLQAVWKVYQTHNIPIIHHSCGDIRPVLDDLVELGLDVLNPVQPEAMPLESIARRYGPRLSFYGGISEQKVLSFGTPADIKVEVQHCVELLGEHGGYIIAPSQAVLSDVPAENVRALLDAMLMYCGSKR
jgi:uroporphyrinogen decarboxylase